MKLPAFHIPPIATFGAAVIASIFNAAVIIAIALLPWPAESASTRIVALQWLGLAQTMITAVVVISWAWGRPENLNLSIAGQSVTLDFDKKDDPPPPLD